MNSRPNSGHVGKEIFIAYTYDGDGNIGRLAIGGGTKEGFPYYIFMIYDLRGNRLIREQYRNGSVDVTEGYRYNERNELTERVRAGSLTTYSYDQNGSLISEEEEGRRSEYRYDLLNRQTYVKTLDGKSRRTSMTVKVCVQGLRRTGSIQRSCSITGKSLRNVTGKVRLSEGM